MPWMATLGVLLVELRRVAGRLLVFFFMVLKQKVPLLAGLSGVLCVTFTNDALFHQVPLGPEKNSYKNKIVSCSQEQETVKTPVLQQEIRTIGFF